MSGFLQPRVAVIGATGFIGSHLVERLVKDGAAVLSVARSSGRTANLSAIEGSHRFAECDILNSSRLKDLLRGFRPQLVYHMACHPDAGESYEQAEMSIRVNTLGTLNVFEAAQSAAATRLIFADSVKVYGNGLTPPGADAPLNPVCSYAVSKAAAWQLAKVLASSGSLEVVSLRTTFVYGPRQNWNLITYVYDCAKKNVPVRLQGGNQTRDPLYVADAVEAFIRAGHSPTAAGNAIPIGGGQELTVMNLSEAIVASLGTAVPILASAEPLRPTEIWRSYSENREALSLLGWTPSLTLQEGLRLTLNAHGVTAPLARVSAMAAGISPQA